MNVVEVDRRNGLSATAFYEAYQKPKKPVVLTDFVDDWPAVKKWTFDFFRENYGRYTVPICDAAFHEAGVAYMKHSHLMRFGDYLNLIENHPTEKRIHNFQVMREAPELASDFIRPHLKGLHFFRFALLFFGGAGSRLNLHYDIDCSHVFLTHFITRKEVYLFPPGEGRLLYQHPYTVQSHIDVLNPDLKAFPAFQFTTPHHAVLNHGETLFIPSRWWHFVYYIEGGYSLAIRARESLTNAIKGSWNLVRHFVVDKGMNALSGGGWKRWKVREAQRRAASALEKIKSQL